MLGCEIRLETVGMYSRLQILERRGMRPRMSSIGWYSRAPRTPSNPSQVHSEFHSRIEHKPLQGLEVKAALKIRLDSHQFINSLLHVIRVAPIKYQHTGR